MDVEKVKVVLEVLERSSDELEKDRLKALWNLAFYLRDLEDVKEGTKALELLSEYLGIRNKIEANEILKICAQAQSEERSKSRLGGFMG